MIWFVLLFALGACLGSFVNLVSLRLPALLDGQSGYELWGFQIVRRDRCLARCNAFSLTNIDHTKFLSTMQWFIYCRNISMLCGFRLTVPVMQSNIHIIRMLP